MYEILAQCFLNCGVDQYQKDAIEMLENALILGFCKNFTFIVICFDIDFSLFHT